MTDVTGQLQLWYWPKVIEYIQAKHNRLAMRHCMMFPQPSDLGPPKCYLKLIGPWEIWMKFYICNFQMDLVIDGWGISCEIVLIWMSLDFTDYQSTLVQVMARCRQATSHYLSQCWPRSLSLYGVTRLQWVYKIWQHPFIIASWIKSRTRGPFY